MKANKIIYWISTALISLMMLFAAFAYFIDPAAKVGFVHLGYPDYFRIELGTAKILGVIALLIPIIPVKIKEFAYFGFTITFVSAFISHISIGDPVNVAIRPVFAFVILAVSYFTYNKITKI
jgi:hypothetical protein